jgi:hypothetical protein
MQLGCINWGVKHMAWNRDEEEVDKMIENMKSRTKGRYITQGVAFNKECPRQMELLKKCLLFSVSFSALAKEALFVRLGEAPQPRSVTQLKPVQPKQKRNLGNFI